MRIALISDLHANEVALAAVLADIARVGVDQIVCLGDVATLGPHPELGAPDACAISAAPASRATTMPSCSTPR